MLPSLSNIHDDMGFGERFERTLLPALTLTLVVTAHMMRMTRAAIINLLASEYIEMARLKGLSAFRIIVMHAFPNALAPIINVIALNLAYLITGVVVVEVVFVYPGIGQLFVDSVKIRDIPVVLLGGESAILKSGRFILRDIKDERQEVARMVGIVSEVLFFEGAVYHRDSLSWMKVEDYQIKEAVFPRIRNG